MTGSDARPSAGSIREAYERIRQGIRETPVQLSPSLSASCGVPVYLKLENFQRTGSFKLRGALHKLVRISQGGAGAPGGVVAASAGNHGLGVACAAGQLGLEAEIFLPETASQESALAIAAHGARVTRHGDDCLETEQHARRLAVDSGRIYVSPYNDLDVVEGQGTVAVELERQLGHFDAIFIATGGGGLLAGVGTYVKSLEGAVDVLACSPERSPVLHDSLRAGRVVESTVRPTLSHSTAGGVESGAVTLDLCARVVDESLLVGEEQIAAAIRHALERERMLIEGAAGVAIAGCLAYCRERRFSSSQRVVVVVCGANIDPSDLRSVLGSS